MVGENGKGARRRYASVLKNRAELSNETVDATIGFPRLTRVIFCRPKNSIPSFLKRESRAGMMPMRSRVLVWFLAVLAALVVTEVRVGIVEHRGHSAERLPVFDLRVR